VKIGILGGTFDPIHNGHIIIAGETRKQLNLTEVLFVPAGMPWLKANTPISPVEHRVAMLSLAIGNIPCYKLSTVEIDRTGPSYTVDTIAGLRNERGAGIELFFILGWDSLAELPQWHEPQRLVKMCYLVAIPRPGYSPPDLNSLETLMPGISQRVILLDGPLVDISATAIRQRVAQGKTIENLVPEPVERYIKQHKLYVSR
jgi:nicotinate-nucleotide adenylyltransferase